MDIDFLGDTEPRSFSDATKKAYNYIDDILAEESQALREKPTFVFCANDNMAIGARMAISNHPPERLAEYRDIRIICYDASAFVAMHIDRGDRYLWRAIDQRYTEFINSAVEAAATILDGEQPDQRHIMITPVVYRR